MSRRKQPDAGQSKPGRDPSGPDAAPTTGPFAHDPAKVTAPVNPTRQTPQPEASDDVILQTERAEAAPDAAAPMTDAELRDTPEASDATPDAEIAQDDPAPRDPAPDPATSTAQDAGPGQAPDTVTIRQGGFWSMLFGGALAASIGVVASPYILSSEMLEGRVPAFLAPQQEGEDEVETQLASQQDRLDGLEMRLDDLSGDIQTAMDRPDPPPDLSDEVAALTDAQDSVETRIGDIENRFGSVEEQLADVGEQIGDLGDRLTAVEERPIPTSDDSEVSSSELESLRDRLEEQRADMESRRSDIEELTSRIETLTTNLEAQNATIAEQRETLDNQSDTLAALQEEAEAEEQAARDSARATLQQAALNRVTTALETGSPFADALADLRDTGVEVPAALDDVAETGVPTRTELTQSFPNAARAALSRVRDAQDNPGAIEIGDFFRSQLGMRSLVPREGDSPDAILSRAEAALRDGRIGEALAEIESLPEEARAELDGWVARATQRQEALSAADALSGRLN